MKNASEVYMFVETYAERGSKGIHLLKLNQETGEVKTLQEIEAPNSSFLTLNSSGTRVYATQEGPTEEKSAVRAFAFDRNTEALTAINIVEEGGAAPCHILVSPDDRLVTTANYMGGSLSIYEVTQEGGLRYRRSISYEGHGPNPQRQEAPHVHFGIYSPDGKYLFVTDLGIDKVNKFRVKPATDEFLQEGNPSFYQIEPGSGPRHMAFHPNGKYAYLLTELLGEVIVFHYDGEDLHPIQTVKANTQGARQCGDIHVTPDGKYLYASNRYDAGDGLALFSIEAETGKLSSIGYQRTKVNPRNFAVTPNGKLLLVACQDSDVIQIYKIKANGTLEFTDKEIALSMPVCIKFLI